MISHAQKYSIEQVMVQQGTNLPKKPQRGQQSFHRGQEALGTVRKCCGQRMAAENPRMRR